MSHISYISTAREARNRRKKRKYRRVITKKMNTVELKSLLENKRRRGKMGPDDKIEREQLLREIKKLENYIPA